MLPCPQKFPAELLLPLMLKLALVKKSVSLYSNLTIIRNTELGITFFTHWIHRERTGWPWLVGSISICLCMRRKNQQKPACWWDQASSFWTETWQAKVEVVSILTSAVRASEATVMASDWDAQLSSGQQFLNDCLPNVRSSSVWGKGQLLFSQNNASV